MYVVKTLPRIRRKFFGKAPVKFLLANLVDVRRLGFDGVSRLTLSMTYRIVHTTEYSYQDLVSVCFNHALLTPRTVQSAFTSQWCHESTTLVSPKPDDVAHGTDFFGNHVQYFAIHTTHRRLTVKTASIVERTMLAEPTPERFAQSCAWNEWRHIGSGTCSGNHRKDNTLNTVNTVTMAQQFALDSPLVQASEQLRHYAAPSFPVGRPLLEAVYELTQRIYADFRFVAGFTTISTPLSVVLRERKGVCQDFAQVAIGCLRSLGIAARYVSGYIETLPPTGKERLVGADASHAWISVFEPSLGWVDFDPTNNQAVSNRHITLAVGRDYSDVPPLKGVVLSGGTAALKVSVDMERVR